jgi:hypothetical protein
VDLDRVRAVLKECEWSAIVDDHGDHCCPICAAEEQPDGTHAPDCELAACLAELAK